jgi:hypothetical protein
MGRKAWTSRHSWCLLPLRQSCCCAPVRRRRRRATRRSWPRARAPSSGTRRPPRRAAAGWGRSGRACAPTARDPKLKRYVNSPNGKKVMAACKVPVPSCWTPFGWPAASSVTGLGYLTEMQSRTVCVTVVYVACFPCMLWRVLRMYGDVAS